LDFVLDEWIVKLAADREDSERVLVAGHGRELLVGAAVEGDVDHLQLGREALDAQTLGTEDATAQDVDVVLLSKLGGKLQRLGRVALRIDVDDLKRPTVDP